MKKEITIAIIIMAILIVIMAMTGCGYRGYIIVRDNPTDIVSVKKQGIIHKKDITGKGVDVWSNKPLIIKMTKDKDGNITYEYSSQKTSVWEKIFGTYKVLKPNEVSVGK